MTLRSEIFEQPAVLERLLRTQRAAAGEIAEAIQRRGVRSVFIAARGSSDNAAVYGKYLWGSLNALPVALAAPSLFTVYRTPPRLDGSLVIGVSQSGQSPDIVGVVEEGRRQGALTLAITNDSASPLAAAADMVLDTGAGPELAVAASKTYTAQLLAIALLCAASRDDAGLFSELERVPALVEEALGLDHVIASAAERYRYMDQCVVLGRGFNYATAYEWSLKLKELSYVVAEPYSSTDFRHGPVAIVGDGFPVLAVAPAGAVFDDALALLETLSAEHRAELLVVSNEDRALALARTGLRLPRDLPEWLSPLVAIVPGQLFSYHLTRAKGYDTENPRRLRKVTRTL
ncbi:MAG: SIS domain-containing protein [Thermoanaerobaculia bacterium]|nr:SIS domain-containing protein [Thermoanaerobaculia bacterium]